MREIRKTIRLTREEAKRVEEAAKMRGVTISELIRCLVNEKPLPRVSYKRLARQNEALKRLVYEVNKIGNNINQMARLCNYRRGVDLSVLVELRRIEKSLSGVLDAVLEEGRGDADKQGC